MLEFNELCPALLHRWMLEDRLPNFRTFYESSQAFITESDEAGPPYLEPWIQWYSIHTGLSFQQHRVFHLTDGPKANHKDVWQILMDSGKTVGNCSSMNAKGFAKAGSFFLPDPWCRTEKAFPAELDAFSRVISQQVQEYTNGNRGLKASDCLSFFAFLIRHGLSAKTTAAIATQIIADTVVNKQNSWKRAVLQDRLQFDVFRYYQRKLRPDFSTFFVNSTAHYQHAYWRHMSPESFVHRPRPEELSAFKNAILFGYQKMDELVGEFFEFEKDDVILMFTTALSQQPYLKNEEFGGQHFYRPKNIDSLLGMFDITYDRVLAVMTHQYLVQFKDPASADNARRLLRRLKYQGQDVFEFTEAERNSLYFGNQIKSLIPAGARIEVEDQPAMSFAHDDLFYRIPETKSGCHHPDGVLWVKTGSHKMHESKTSILDILPTILGYFDIEPDVGVRRLFKGRNLVPILN